MIQILFTMFSTLAMLVSAINRNTASLSIIIAAISIFIGFIYLSKQEERIRIPKFFNLIIIFNVILFIYPLFIESKNNPLYYAFMFTISSLYWVLFYNLKKGFIILKWIILSVPIFTSLIYILSNTIDPEIIKFSELFFIENLSGRHYLIGNTWVFALLAIAFDNLNKFDLSKAVTYLSALFFIILANSRSAYLSLIAGLLSFSSRFNLNSKFKKITIILCILTTIFFVVSSIGRTTIFSRPYFIQSVESFVKYPLGVGMGNFEKISTEYYTKEKDLSKFSIYTHNIFLETLSGVGIFSIIFLIFIYKSIYSIFKSKGKQLDAWSIVFIAMSLNFMVDTTYTIPGMFWLWFMVYGTSQSRKGIKE